DCAHAPDARVGVCGKAGPLFVAGVDGLEGAVPEHFVESQDIVPWDAENMFHAISLQPLNEILTNGGGCVHKKIVRLSNAWSNARGGKTMINRIGMIHRILGREVSCVPVVRSGRGNCCANSFKNPVHPVNHVNPVLPRQRAFTELYEQLLEPCEA